jgi:chromosomal replication initiation ATPase DnaA
LTIDNFLQGFALKRLAAAACPIWPVTAAFLAEQRNAVLGGGTGTGKSHLATGELHSRRARGRSG